MVRAETEEENVVEEYDEGDKKTVADRIEFATIIDENKIVFNAVHISVVSFLEEGSKRRYSTQQVHKNILSNLPISLSGTPARPP